MKKRIISVIAIVALVAMSGCQSTAEGQVEHAVAEEEETQNESSIENQEGQESEGTESEEEAVDEHSTAELEDSQQSNVDYSYEVNPENFTVEPLTEEAESQVALLTFDDAPDGNAVEMAEILKEHDAPAIFFVNGMYLESEEGKEKLKKIHEMGYEIGNHTYTHPTLTDISEEQQREEIVKVNDLVEEITGERPRFFRAPHGLNTDYTKRVAEEEDMVLMNWTYGYDWEPEYQEPGALADIMVNTAYLNDGANLLMHDREWTKEALDGIITGLREKGYTLVDPDLIYSPNKGGQAE
ncbi:polysaccharide deacetylase family protein [Oceanobacillus piezotolerans]|uniref:Polysaccharide deacetylase family protein n=1 Tax=Oceanobacillus piezotolerans TaxID=2448030 RepID=A0A498DBX7_9BACI|nr:polysaccharide deacetylase family protein [Oceanobacillus piezotolerans]RLL47068.1 polysaccharide deacetylase family protein [Oceanobacillus piezotolerans]